MVRGFRSLFWDGTKLKNRGNLRSSCEVVSELLRSFICGMCVLAEKGNKNILFQTGCQKNRKPNYYSKLRSSLVEAAFASNSGFGNAVSNEGNETSRAL